MTGKERKGGIFQGMQKPVLFLAAILVVYAILFFTLPERAMDALRISVNILLNLIIPLCLVFVIMVLLNLFLKPAKVALLLGKGSGLKGIALSTAGGIISTGPIYAWYPLLKDIKAKGAGYVPIAIFLNNRAVKPFLLPVMIAYFGWIFVALLTVLTIVFAVLMGYAMNICMRE